MRRLFSILCVILLLLFLTCCTTAPKSGNNNQDALSISKYSDVTKLHYEETKDGYKGALLRIDDITIQEIKNWVSACKDTNGYYEYIYSSPDSWDMFIYTPINSSDGYTSFKFLVEDSTTKIYVKSEPKDTITQQQNYILIRIQAPPRGSWPNSSELFIDDKKIECQKAEFTT